MSVCTIASVGVLIQIRSHFSRNEWFPLSSSSCFLSCLDRSGDHLRRSKKNKIRTCEDANQERILFYNSCLRIGPDCSFIPKKTPKKNPQFHKTPFYTTAVTRHSATWRHTLLCCNHLKPRLTTPDTKQPGTRCQVAGGQAGGRAVPFLQVASDAECGGASWRPPTDSRGNGGKRWGEGWEAGPGGRKAEGKKEESKWESKWRRGNECVHS